LETVVVPSAWRTAFPNVPSGRRTSEDVGMLDEPLFFAAVDVGVVTAGRRALGFESSVLVDGVVVTATAGFLISGLAADVVPVGFGRATVGLGVATWTLGFGVITVAFGIVTVCRGTWTVCRGTTMLGLGIFGLGMFGLGMFGLGMLMTGFGISMAAAGAARARSTKLKARRDTMPLTMAAS
jgi:hypothetical protein